MKHIRCVLLLPLLLIAPPGCGESPGEDGPGQQTTTLTLWLSATPHQEAYEAVLDRFYEAHPGVRVQIVQTPNDGLIEKFRNAIRARKGMPDLVELEISSAAGFLAGPEAGLPLIDLWPRLQASGLDQRLPAARLAPYRRGAGLYGVPRDIHPVMLAYRADLFEQLGLDMAELTTWDRFTEAGRRVKRETGRWMIEMSTGSYEIFEIFLFQRGGGYFDADGELIMDNETAVDTLAWYTRQVAGRTAIGYSPADTAAQWPLLGKAIQEGQILSLTCPDWATRFIVQQHAPGAAGKMKLAPLPAFEEGGRRTSTRGGTMMGVTSACVDPDLAWELVEFLYFNPDVAGPIFEATHVVPPDRGQWDMPALAEHKSYWSGQAIGLEYVALADEVPPQYANALVQRAKQEMNQVVLDCRDWLNAHAGADDAELRAFVSGRLGEAAGGIRRRMQRGR